MTNVGLIFISWTNTTPDEFLCCFVSAGHVNKKSFSANLLKTIITFIHSFLDITQLLILLNSYKQLVLISLCRWDFVHLMLCRAAGQERNKMWKAMTYEVRPARLKKNMSKPNWCTTCGPFEKSLAMGTLRPDVEFQMCLQALTYVR